jgi:hypothetical protein
VSTRHGRGQRADYSRVAARVLGLCHGGGRAVPQGQKCKIFTYLWLSTAV